MGEEPIEIGRDVIAEIRTPDAYLKIRDKGTLEMAEKLLERLRVLLEAKKEKPEPGV